MKKLLKLVGAIGVLMIVGSSTIYAASPAVKQNSILEVNSSLLPANIDESVDFVKKTPRGVFFSAADLKIENEDGEIGVVGHAFMSTEIDELYMTIYLDRWVDDDHWEQVDYFEFEFYAEDYPDGLTSELVGFTLTGYPTGHYYRLRGSYAAVKDGVIEGFAPVTDGILIQ